MKKNLKRKLSIDDLKVKSFSATLRNGQMAELQGGSIVNTTIGDTDLSCLTNVLCSGGGATDGGASQTASVDCCGETQVSNCFTQDC